MKTKEQITYALEDHDDRVNEGGAEIRMLGSYDAEGNGEYTVFLVIVDGKVIVNTTNEDHAIDRYMEER